MHDIHRRMVMLLESDRNTPERDNAGIITPEGIDAKVRRESIGDCLKIVESEMKKKGFSVGS